MSSPSDKSKVGYGRPPLRTRWKKGQSGNPRKKLRQPKSEIEQLDRLLLSYVTISLNGVPTRVSALAAIISQLQRKELSGNCKASRTLLKYQRLAKEHDDRPRHIELRFTGDDARDAGGNGTGGNGHD
ncbi:DUF5681 domain-containing protein [Bradyrhizobium sp.]|uniref:DUF5681 domain-containing protein n=1 Tax=Bradyrhizobium sp. TaxID=376 RepID=UPI0039E50AE8